MSTVTPVAARMRRFATRAALSTTFVALATGAIFTGSFAAPSTPSANAAEDACPAVEVVFARGTNEAPGVGATGQSFVDALTARLPGKSIDVYGVNYPASLNFGQAADGIVDASNRFRRSRRTARPPTSSSAATRRVRQWPATPPPIPSPPDSTCRTESQARCRLRSPRTSRPWSCSARRIPGS